MIFDCKCRFLGKETKLSKKGNEYIVITIMQNTTTLTVMSDVDINSEFGKEFIAILDYNPQYKNIRLVGAK